MEQKKSVLVVDDDIMLLKMAEEFLGEAYAASLAKSGRQALALLRTGFVPDVVLLDIDMPGMDGYETLEDIRKIPAMYAVPVMFLTGLSEPEWELKGLSAGAADYVTKPFVREILLARIALQLKNREKFLDVIRIQKLQGETGFDEAKFLSLTDCLTLTERKIARLICRGADNKEISEQLHYSYPYVKKVICVIFEKLGVQKRSELRKLLLK